MSTLIEKGLSREEAYDLVQVIAQKSYNEDISFIELVKEQSLIKKLLNEKEIDSLFTLEYYLKSVDEIYTRVGIK